MSLNSIWVFTVLLAGIQTRQLSGKTFISVKEFRMITATMMNAVIIPSLSLVTFIRRNISEKQGGGSHVAEVYFDLDWSSCGEKKKEDDKKRVRRKVRFCESHV